MKCKKNVVITGGAGFIGSHLIDRFITDDDIGKIYILDNLIRTGNYRNLDHILVKSAPSIEFIHADVSTFDYSYFSGIIDEVYHLAATRINRCSKFNREGHNYIADGGFNIVDFCYKKRAKLFFASSASVYNKPKRFPIEETDLKNPHTIYGAGKLYTENLIQSYDQMYDFNYVINRFFSVYGIRMDCHGAYTEVIYNWLNHLIHKKNTPIIVYGDPHAKILDLVYVSDVVDAIQLSMSQTNKEILNVSTEQGITLSKLISIIKDVTGISFNIKIVDDNRTDIETKRVGSTKKLRNLGWSQQVKIEEGILKTWKWLYYGKQS